MCEDCMPWRWIDTQWMIGRKEGRTLDSNPFNNVYSIYMLSVILIMRIEWKESKWMRMCLVVIWSQFDFCNS